MYAYTALLHRVVDGDTVDVTIDLGFRITTAQRIRLSGINAPEHNTKAGQEAIKAVDYWFHSRPGPYYLESRLPGGGDKYGRFLATIYADVLKKDCLNDYLVREGHAKPWDGQGVKPT